MVDWRLVLAVALGIALAGLVLLGLAGCSEYKVLGGHRPRLHDHVRQRNLAGRSESRQRRAETGTRVLRPELKTRTAREMCGSTA